jgi:hypothetical protein
MQTNQAKEMDEEIRNAEEKNKSEQQSTKKKKT